ncbi:hypothetical protein Dda_6073 [Drechslerella dactyloides]|uniref:Uncharacterized protein n=1 Tax=Drechslerella dactyloides TaxID=74499 RepID=A0AAD6IUX5_DREDA|nr:hypothetical protein Dda_6073 [Drechslerella dactyloides]
MATTAQPLPSNLLLLARQLVRFHADHNVTDAHRNLIPVVSIFQAHWLLEELSPQARRVHPEYFKEDEAEEEYPQHWLTIQGLQGALLSFDQLAAPMLQMWLPSVIFEPAGITGLRNNLRIEIKSTPDPDIETENLVRKAADIAFSLFSMHRSLNFLQNILQRTVADWNTLNIRPHVYQYFPTADTAARMSVLNFIRELKTRSFKIWIDSNKSLGGSDAETTRRLWTHPGSGLLSHQFRIDQPRLVPVTHDDYGAFRLAINEVTVKAARRAAAIAIDRHSSTEMRRVAINNWTNFLFIMAISIAHEFVHVFILMLNGGNPGTRTPLTVFGQMELHERYPGVNLTQADKDWIQQPDLNRIPNGLQYKISGESGSRWEELMFEGNLACYFSNSLLLPGWQREDSSGIPYLV